MIFLRNIEIIFRNEFALMSLIGSVFMRTLHLVSIQFAKLFGKFTVLIDTRTDERITFSQRFDRSTLNKCNFIKG